MCPAVDLSPAPTRGKGGKHTLESALVPLTGVCAPWGEPPLGGFPPPIPTAGLREPKLHPFPSPLALGVGLRWEHPLPPPQVGTGPLSWGLPGAGEERPH